MVLITLGYFGGFTDEPLIGVEGGGGATFWTQTGSDIYFNGRVGVGTGSPSSELDVNGVITATGGASTGWNTAYSERRQWDGGSINLNSSTGRTSLGLGTGDSPTFTDLELTGNLELPATTSSAGIIKLGGYNFIHNYGNCNTFIGENAGNLTMTGSYNSALGFYALCSDTTGNDNLAMGYCALDSNTTGNNNSAMGNYALYSNIAGFDNLALGKFTLYKNTTGNYNLALGDSALYSNTTGNYNSALGDYALYSNTTGGENIALGVHAGYSNQTGSGNVFLGNNAGRYEMGSNKLYIDNSDTSAPLIWGNFSTSRVGINCIASANTLEVEGSASKTVAGDWLANSDRRIKTDIRDVDNALEMVMKLRPVKFKYTRDYRESHRSVEDHDYYNFIAQEYRDVFPQAVKGSGEYLKGDSEEILQIDTHNVKVVAIKAIQEQQDEIKELKKRIEALENALGKI
ncbi:MAG: tail fiber domain-containing protein [Candidatus Euphemobacter frigidus]|nr:tail fiber domain-containing protein [Candidatus Euphemobacter frigidus]